MTNGRASGHPEGVTYERLWERLVEYLDEAGSAREVTGGIEVSFLTQDGVTRTVQVVVTPHQWDDYVSTLFGDGEPRATGLRARVTSQPDDLRFLVYDGSYDWKPSSKPTLPEDPEIAVLDELARQRPEGIGRWIVTDRDGNVIDEFRPDKD